MDVKVSGEIYVEALTGVLNVAAALKASMIPNRFAATFDCAGDVVEQCRLEQWWRKSLH